MSEGKKIDLTDELLEAYALSLFEFEKSFRDLDWHKKLDWLPVYKKILQTGYYLKMTYPKETGGV